MPDEFFIDSYYICILCIKNANVITYNLLLITYNFNICQQKLLQQLGQHLIRQK